MNNTNENGLFCSHCKGWGVNHIPVKNNFEVCKVCNGEGVSIEKDGMILFWGNQSIIDKKIKIKISQLDINKALFVSLLVIVAIIIWFILTKSDQYTNLISSLL